MSFIKSAQNVIADNEQIKQAIWPFRPEEWRVAERELDSTKRMQDKSVASIEDKGPKLTSHLPRPSITMPPPPKSAPAQTPASVATAPDPSPAPTPAAPAPAAPAPAAPAPAAPAPAAPAPAAPAPAAPGIGSHIRGAWNSLTPTGKGVVGASAAAPIVAGTALAGTAALTGTVLAARHFWKKRQAQRAQQQAQPQQAQAAPPQQMVRTASAPKLAFGVMGGPTAQSPVGQWGAVGGPLAGALKNSPLQRGMSTVGRAVTAAPRMIGQAAKNAVNPFKGASADTEVLYRLYQQRWGLL